MTALTVGVKYRIQNVDLQTYLEVLDSTSDVSSVDNAKLRPVKETNRQYWTFEKVPLHDYSSYYYVRNVANDKIYFNSISTGTCTGHASNARGLVGVTQFSDGAYRLSFYYGVTNPAYHYWYPDPNDTTRVILGTTATELDSQKWILVPVSTPQLQVEPVRGYPLETGIYLIRNLNGRNLFLTCDEDENDVYIETQLDQSTDYQRWNVTYQSSGTYVIQNVGRQSHLGCLNAMPFSGATVAGMEKTFEWDLQSIGGFAWWLRFPKKEYSLGFQTHEVRDESEPCLVRSDVSPSQMWFMENLDFEPNGKGKIHADRQLDEGNYSLQSCHDQTIYMVASSDLTHITAGTSNKFMFHLKYIKEHSASFKLTYTTSGTNPVTRSVAADTSDDYLTLKAKETPFVLLKKARGQYIICLSTDSAHPRQVVSGRIKTDTNGNNVFAIEEETDETLQKWRFIPTK